MKILMNCAKRTGFYLKQSEISLTMVKRVKKSTADFLRDYFGVVSLESFGLLGKDYSIDASGMVLQYVWICKNIVIYQLTKSLI